MLTSDTTRRECTLSLSVICWDYNIPVFPILRRVIQDDTRIPAGEEVESVSTSSARAVVVQKLL